MIGWAVETLAATTLLLLLVLALRGPVARRFGPQAAYALWALPALRMVLPPLPQSWRPVDFQPVIGAATEPGVVMLGVPVIEVPALPQGWGMADVPLAIVALWLLGAIGFVGWHAVRHHRFCAKVLASGRAKGVAGGHVRMIETRHAAGPLAFGVVQRYVAMPIDFRERYDDREQALALAHELGHHARGDLLANWVALVILGCHWFNPVAWRAFRAFRADQEMACDAMVLARATPGVRHAYATAIVKSAHGQALSAACHLHSVNELKGRLIMLSKHRVMSPAARRIAGSATLALAVAGLGITASGTQAAETIRTKMETATGVEIAAVEAKAAAALAPVAAIVPARAAPAVPVVAVVRTGPSVPSVPAAPAAAPLPAVPAQGAQPARPAAPPTPPMVARNGQQVRKIMVRQIGDDGRVISETVSEVPEVTSARCGTGAGDVNRTTTFTRTRDGRTRTVICTDRIERIAMIASRDAAAASISGQRAAAQGRIAAASGLRAAMDGLRAARQAIESNPRIPADDRREALAEIDAGMREVQAEIAGQD